MSETNKSKGLGDTVEKITRATGVKSLTELAMRATGYTDCGCDKRKAWLNKQFPYYK
jgi:hypothetical protein|tara:strand:+ start:689 stop:859 length:171 start_codon:yes stop_codon:yes gene_type:complete